MAAERCTACGCVHETPVDVCQKCGCELNGAAPRLAASIPAGKVPADLKEWAVADVNVEEFLAGVREIERTGGLELKDFIHELEEAAGPRERPDHD
jgi:hypothetical protein